jgi:hypothetical protein
MLACLLREPWGIDTESLQLYRYTVKKEEKGGSQCFVETVVKS